MSYNHIVSCEDQYNQLVDYIEDSYYAIFPADRSTPGVYEMLFRLREAAKYQKKHEDLVMSDIQHSRAVIGDIIKALLDDHVHIDSDNEEEEEEE